MTLRDHILGCILGTAVGDALGLPREGLSRRRAQRLFGGPPLHHAFIWGRGLCSDDTEHTALIAQALIESAGNPADFARCFARRLRWWIARLPAGTGLATLRACLRLWLGHSPRTSGVYSAGNGPAMRSALLGVVAQDQEELTELVRASTRITHTDPRAGEGAMIVAAAAHWISHREGERLDGTTVARRLAELANDEGLHRAMGGLEPALVRERPVAAFADELGCANGVSGFVNKTVPLAVYCWLRHRGDFRAAVETAVTLGGDTDTVGAITGALAGAESGARAIPDEWLSNLAEWPATVTWLSELTESLAASLQDPTPKRPPKLPGLLLLGRNLVFLVLVLGHGLRRLAPPY